jgi:hypothetical protein
MKFLRSHTNAPQVTRPATRPNTAQRAQRTHLTLATHHLDGMSETFCLTQVYHDGKWIWGLRAIRDVPVDDPIVGSSEYKGTRINGPITEDRLFRPADAAYVMETVHPLLPRVALI